MKIFFGVLSMIVWTGLFLVMIVVAIILIGPYLLYEAFRFFNESLTTKQDKPVFKSSLIYSRKEIHAITDDLAQTKAAFAYMEQAFDNVSRERDELRNTLESIRDYWNRDRNDEAMHDACWFAINTAEEAISRTSKPSNKPLKIFQA